MNFRAALEACPPGLCFKEEHSSWNEYAVQFGCTREGRAFWTAGGTAGGWLEEKDIEGWQSRPGVYRLYSTMGSSIPITPTEAQRLYEGILAREAKDSKVLDHDREAFVGKVQEMVRRNGAIPEEADVKVLLPARLNALAVDIIRVIDGTAHPTDPGYQLIPRNCRINKGCIDGAHHQDISGDLEALFLEIQS